VAKRTVGELAVDFLREAAVLTAVFIPLDRVVSKEEPFTEQWVWITVLVSVGLFLGAVILEKLRTEPT